MAVGAEAPTRCHPVVVDHPQAAKSHLCWVVVTREAERVKRIQPPKIGAAAFM